MRIILLRHGRPHLPPWARITAAEFPRWIAAYNAAELDPQSSPPPAARAWAQTGAHLVCSDLARATASARALGGPSPHHIDPLFRELDLPYGHWPTPALPPGLWAALFRGLWLLGYAQHAESHQAGKNRAQQGAERLQALAQKHGSVLLVGHGFLNRYLALALRRKGWHGPAQPGHRYWDASVYEKEAHLL